MSDTQSLATVDYLSSDDDALFDPIPTSPQSSGSSRGAEGAKAQGKSGTIRSNQRRKSRISAHFRALTESVGTGPNSIMKELENANLLQPDISKSLDDAFGEKRREKLLAKLIGYSKSNYAKERSLLALRHICTIALHNVDCRHALVELGAEEVLRSPKSSYRSEDHKIWTTRALLCVDSISINASFQSFVVRCSGSSLWRGFPEASEAMKQILNCLQEPDPEILWVVTQIAELPIVYPASLLILLELLGHHTKNRALNQFAIEKLESLGVNYEGSLYQLVGNSTWPPEYGLDSVILELTLKSIEEGTQSGTYALQRIVDKVCVFTTAGVPEPQIPGNPEALQPRALLATFLGDYRVLDQAKSTLQRYIASLKSNEYTRLLYDMRNQTLERLHDRIIIAPERVGGTSYSGSRYRIIYEKLREVSLCGNESTQLSGIAHILSVVKRDRYEREMLPLDVLGLVKTFATVVVSHVLETAALQLLDVLSAGPTSLKGHPATWCSVTKKSLKCNHCQHHMNPIETESVLGKHSFFVARIVCDGSNYGCTAPGRHHHCGFAKRAAGSANYHAIIPIRLGLKPAIVDTSESTSLELLAGDPSTLRWLLIRWGATFSAKGHIPVVSSRTKAGRHEFFAKLASDHVCGPVVEGANAILVPKWSHTLGYHDAEMSSVFYVLVHAEDPAVYEKCHGNSSTSQDG